MKPIFLEDINYLGKPYWIEIEGYDNMVCEVSGNFAFAPSKIMGWDCKTIGDIWKKQKEVNFAPRIRYWEDKPTKEERKAGEWSNADRAWPPSTIFSAFRTQKEMDAMYEKYLKTGQTQFN